MDVSHVPALAGHVVVVDDDAFVRRIVGDRLTANGFLVALAEDGAGALALVAQRPPDAIVLDLNLPDAQGLGLLPVLQQRAPETPIVILTATDDITFLRAALGAGAHDYLTKPWVDEVLIARVRAAARLGQSLRALTAANEQLRRLAAIDELTGLANRRALRSRLDDLVAIAERGGGAFGVILVDLDELAGVNGRKGHRAGDERIADAADALRTVCRRGDLVGRWSGDAFLALVTHGRPEELVLATERYRRTVEQRLAGPGARAGHATWTLGDTAEMLLDRADAMLRAAPRPATR